MAFGREQLVDVSRGFIASIGKLKMIPRTGWISHDIRLQDVESVAEHTFSTSTLAMLLTDMEASADRNIDVEKVLRMALVHDIAEALTFDISKSYLEYLGSKGEAVKRNVEEAAWTHIVKGIGKASIRTQYARLQSEFNTGKTLESQIVHSADKLDILFQIIAYHRRGYPRRTLIDLWSSTNRSLLGVRIPSVDKLRRTAVRLYKAAT